MFIHYFDDYQELPEECPFRQFQKPPPMQPFKPPMGGGNQYGPPPQPPMGGGKQGGPPSGPPPKGAPPVKGKGVNVKAIDPGAIKLCKYTYVYIWPEYGNGFWAWLTFVGRKSCAGWKWTGRTWRYFGIDLKRIDRFLCY